LRKNDVVHLTPSAFGEKGKSRPGEDGPGPAFTTLIFQKKKEEDLRSGCHPEPSMVEL